MMALIRRRSALIGALLLAVLLGLPSAALGAAIVRQDVDVSEYPTVNLDVALSADLVPGQGEPTFEVFENGFEVKDLTTSSAAEGRDPVDVVLLVDVSGSMRGNPLSNAKTAAQQFVSAMGPEDRVALVAFSSEPYAATGFSSNPALLTQAINLLSAGGDTALYDGLIEAARQFEESDRNRVIVVLSDGGDTTSINNANKALTTITDAAIPLYAVVLSSPDYDPAVLDSLAQRSGGRLISADKAESLTTVFVDIAEELRNIYQISFTSAKPATKDLEIEIRAYNGDVQGTLVTAIENPLYATGELPSTRPAGATPESTALVLAIALVVAAAVGSGVYALGSMLVRDSNAMAQLRYYDEYQAGSSGGSSQGSVSASRGRVMDAVAAVAESRGLTGMVRASLERAGLPLRANEYIFLHVLVTTIAGLVTLVISGRILVSAIVIVVVVAVPILALQVKIERRRKAFEDQLPDVLSLIAGSLRAGWGIQQSIELVVEEIAEPSATEFRRVQSEARFGLPLEQALSRMAERLDSEDFRWTVTAIAIQREVGGNLAEVLDVVATTIRQRAELRRHVASLTAESRFSMIVLSILPIFLLVAMFVLNREYVQVMVETRTGLAALLAGLILLVVGILWINKLTKVEV